MTELEAPGESRRTSVSGKLDHLRYQSRTPGSELTMTLGWVIVVYDNNVRIYFSNHLNQVIG